MRNEMSFLIGPLVRFRTFQYGALECIAWGRGSTGDSETGDAETGDIKTSERERETGNEVHI